MSVDPRYPHVTLHDEQSVRAQLDASLTRLRALGITERELYRRARVDWTANADEHALWDDIVSWRYLLGKSGWDQPAFNAEGES